MSSRIGHVVAEHQLVRLTRERLGEWLPHVLVQVADATGVDRDRVPLPASWLRVTDWRELPEGQSPTVVVASPGLEGEPQRHGQRWSASVLVNVLAVVRGHDYDLTGELASVYGAAITATLVQRPPDAPWLRGFRWVGRERDALPAADQRTVQGALVRFRADVDSVIAEPLPLTEPTPDPYDEPTTWPPASPVTAEVHPR